MAKKDFDNYIQSLRITVGEDLLALEKMKEALVLGETDETMVQSAAKAFNDDRYRLEVLLFAKGLMDRPKRKEKIKKWEKASKLPKQMLVKLENGKDSN